MLELSTVCIQGYFHPMLLFALIQLQTVLSHIEIIQIHADVLKIDTVKNTYICMSSIKSTNNNTLYNAIKATIAIPCDAERNMLPDLE